jgi:hypothetical protein
LLLLQLEVLSESGECELVTRGQLRPRHLQPLLRLLQPLFSLLSHALQTLVLDQEGEGLQGLCQFFVKVLKIKSVLS